MYDIAGAFGVGEFAAYRIAEKMSGVKVLVHSQVSRCVLMDGANDLQEETMDSKEIELVPNSMPDPSYSGLVRLCL